MYWLRSVNPIDLLLFLFMTLAWSLGGWLIVKHAFRLRPVERLVSGLATGLLLFISLSNLIAHVLPLPLTFWVAGGSILLAGLALAVGAELNRSDKDHLIIATRPSGFPQTPKVFALYREDLRQWSQLLALAGLTLVFTLIGRGLALFDDYLHVPLVSVMASGDIPPHFYLNPPERLAYHYGLQVLAANLTRAGDFFPWSAWDVSKALAIALTLSLAWLWVRRLTCSNLAAALGSFLLAFSGGSRFLLLLLPQPALQWVSQQVMLSNSALEGASYLATSLSRPWLADGSGPFPFLFAYHNGIFVPVIFVLGSTGAMPFFTILLMLLLAGRRSFSMSGMVVYSLVFATLALSAEHIFVFLWGGIALGGIIYLIAGRWRKSPVNRKLALQWMAILFLSLVFGLVQGAFLTEAVRNLLLRLDGVQSTTGGTYDYFSFALRWPPALDSAHFGALSFLNPGQLIVLLAEVGPALLLAPLATLLAWRRAQRGDGMLAGLGLAALFSFGIAVFFRYGVERSATRLPAIALWIWILLSYPLLWKFLYLSRSYPSGNDGSGVEGFSPVFLPAEAVLSTAAADSLKIVTRDPHQVRATFTRTLFVIGYGLTVLGGVVIFAIQMTSIPFPQLTYYINSNDARISQQYWNRLPENAQVLDHIPTRAVALLGRASRSNIDFYHPLPYWQALITAPDPAAIAGTGYAYVYMDRTWWISLTPDQQKALQQPCVKTVAAQNPDDGNFRWLLDVRACRQP